jgi:hypothetical protein
MNFFRSRTFLHIIIATNSTSSRNIERLEADIGQGGIVAFRFPDGAIFFGGVDHLFEVVESLRISS